MASLCHSSKMASVAVACPSGGRLCARGTFPAPRRSRSFDRAYRKWSVQWLSCLAAGVHPKKKWKQLGSGRSHVARSSSLITELLVDGDNASIEFIKQAMNRLKDMGGNVRTQVFAEPRRVENRKWNNFLRQPGITFRSVPRSKDYSREPNDEAIEAAMEKCSTRREVHRIAVLTRDADYVDILQKLADTKPVIW
ncbi:unnamed protein product [Durusdinium trenchii]|uniref:NYN domain-containing protein n=1 Tax=Durusdinium trenchii TaxID=1381693 RepID=A0ABP0QPT8_9DINO